MLRNHLNAQKPQQPSYKSLEWLDLSKARFDSQSKGLTEEDTDGKDVYDILSTPIGKPKLMQEVRLQYPFHTAPNTRFEEKETRDRSTEKNLVIEFRKISSASGDLATPNAQESSHRDIWSTEELKRQRISLENKISLENGKDVYNYRSKSLEKAKPFFRKKSSAKAIFTFKFSGKKTIGDINPNAIKLIHDKAFDLYEEEVENNKKKDAERKKTSQFIKIIKKHVDMTKRTRKDTLSALLGRVKEMGLNPFYRLLKLLNTILQKFTVGLKKLVKRLLDPINPDGLFILMWEVVIIGLVFLDLFLLPFTFAFEDDLYYSTDILDTIDTSQFTIYIFNILINLDTSYYDKDGYLISSRKQIIYNYLSGYFLLDVVSSFPYRWTITQPEIENGVLVKRPVTVLKLLRFFRILRCLKVFKKNTIIKRIEQHDYFNPLTMGILNLLRLSLITTCCAHWCACIWYILGTSNISNSWLIKSNLEDETTEERYVASLYFAITTMLTVGYGDISPVNLKERLFGIFLMIMGGGLFGYTMTNIAEIIKSLEREETKRK